MKSNPLTSLLASIRKGDHTAIGKAISFVEDHPTQRVGATFRSPIVIGITGPPGAGKSTLLDRLVAVCRAAGQKVGVLAVDPSSPFTGGAVLGDRLRMQRHSTDEGVFIRSLATRGRAGGLSRAVGGAAKILGAAGFNPVFVETVGVGQGEVDIRKLADRVAVVLAPGWGDEVQAMKAGLLEIADVFVVNKADLPGADRLVDHLRAFTTAPVLTTIAVDGVGVEDVMAVLEGRVGRRGGPSGSPAASRVGAGLAPAHDVSRPVVDHVAVAVPDLAAFTKLYQDVLGLPLERTEDVPSEKVRTAFFAGIPAMGGGMHVELIAPLDPNDDTCSTVRFLKERGGGLHHLAVRVPDIQDALAKAREAGYRVVEPAPRPGAGGAQVAFLHPKSTGGVLIELVESRRGDLARSPAVP